MPEDPVKYYQGVKVLKKLPNSLSDKMKANADTPECQKLHKDLEKAINEATKALTSLQENEAQASLDANLGVFKACGIAKLSDLAPTKLLKVFLSDIKMLEKFAKFWSTSKDVKKKIDKAVAARKAYDS